MMTISFRRMTHAITTASCVSPLRCFLADYYNNATQLVASITVAAPGGQACKCQSPTATKHRNFLATPFLGTAQSKAMVPCLSDPAPFAYFGVRPAPARAVYSLDYTGTATLELNISGFNNSYPVSAYGDVNNVSAPIKLLSQKTAVTVGPAGLIVAQPHPYGNAAAAFDYQDNAPALLIDFLLNNASLGNPRLVLGAMGLSTALIQYGVASPDSAPIVWNPTAATTGVQTLDNGGSPAWVPDPLSGFAVLGQRLWIGRSAVISASASVAAYTRTGANSWTVVAGSPVVMTGITKNFRLTGMIATSVRGSTDTVLYVATTSATNTGTDSRLMRVVVGASNTYVSKTRCTPAIRVALGGHAPCCLADLTLGTSSGGMLQRACLIDWPPSCA